MNRDLLSKAGMKGRNALKHNWTDEERAIVCRDYKGTNASAQVIANELNVTLYAVKGQASKLGILQQKSPPWMSEELERLEELVHRYSVTEIAKRLHRTPNAVKIKAIRLKLKLGLRDDWYTKSEVAEICGVDHKKVQAWIDRKALKASWHNGTKPQKNAMAMWHIEARDLRDFIINYSGELLGRNVDIQQIVWLLA